ncbi:MarR family winged helix-turn-helix transcriptional regulator [Levilactobacillus namurensis]|uniref:MarR family winged helix-turn-helix transcriptional regulator n=1 Tax=Levilactobacillus namurensis TaxID=380393 RepID=UPI0004656C73|nr:MarR family winged helix-turn-helix transcriptional regulator [Levilactobacillus namurensis]
MQIYDYNYHVKKLDILLSKQLSKVLVAQDIPFTDSQATLIMYLYHHQDQVIYQKNLPTILGISGPTGNGLVKRLVQKRALELREDPQDGRLKQLVLVPEIVADITRRQADFERAFADIDRQLTTGMSADEVRMFRNLLKRAIQNMTPNQS